VGPAQAVASCISRDIASTSCSVSQKRKTIDLPIGESKKLRRSESGTKATPEIASRNSGEIASTSCNVAPNRKTIDLPIRDRPSKKPRNSESDTVAIQLQAMTLTSSPTSRSTSILLQSESQFFSKQELRHYFKSGHVDYLAQQLRERVSSYMKINWASFDRERLRLLISQLKEHNETLKHLIRGSTEELMAVVIPICGEKDVRTMGTIFHLAHTYALTE
jgi:hypothetical protein